MHLVTRFAIQNPFFQRGPLKLIQTMSESFDVFRFIASMGQISKG